MTARASACALLAVLGFASAAVAQSPRELRVEGGVARVRQLGRDARDASILSALWRDGDPWFASLIAGSIFAARDSIAAVQGVGALAFRPDPDSHFQTDAGFALGAFGLFNLNRGGNLNAFVRQRFRTGAGGVWLGGAQAFTRRDDRPARATYLDMGGWWTFGDLEATASVGRLRNDDFALMEASRIFLTQEAATYDLDDATLGVHLTRGRLTADLGETWRTGRRSTVGDQTAFTWGASWQFTPRISVVVAGGRQLADPLHGSPDAHLVSALLRLAWRVAPSESPDAAGVATYSRLAPNPAGGATLLLAITAPDSVTVDVAGSFSGWEPVVLHRIPGGWEYQVALPPGRHRVAVRFDGGGWQAPRGLAKLRDEFGGESGLIIVP
jgi:hypothetical protein